MKMIKDNESTLVQLAADLTRSYANEKTRSSEETVAYFEKTLRALKNSCSSLAQGDESQSSEDSLHHLSSTPVPAIPIEDSVTDDYIYCLEDGKKFKMLKRHLRTSYGMSPEQYRKRWGLPGNYPMTAPNFQRRKSSYAKARGFGTHDRLIEERYGGSGRKLRAV